MTEKEIEDLLIENQRLEKLVVTLTHENMELRQAQERGRILFADWILKWLEKKRMSVKENTFQVYEYQVKSYIEPYFREKNLTLSDITPSVLEEYYNQKFKDGLKPETIKKHHSNIHAALNDAVKNQLITYNPADLAERPSMYAFQGNTLTPQQLKQILKAVSGTKYYMPVFIAAVMGLRRSEVIGLKWENINFEEKTMLICHTCVQYVHNNHSELLFADMTKTKTSYRMLPIPEVLFDKLKKFKKRQLNNYAVNRQRYCKEYMKYVCVDDFGKIIKPSRLSEFFRDKTKKLGINCRFHDLRHTCASLLIQNGSPIKSVSQWLGHSSINVTGDIYVHLFYKDKITLAETIDKLLK